MAAVLHPDEDVPHTPCFVTWSRYILGVSKRRWKALIKRAICRSVAQQKLAFLTQRGCDMLQQRFADAQLHLPEGAAPPVAHVACKYCVRDDFDSAQSLARHVASCHGIFSDANYYIRGSLCPSCRLDFGNRNDAVRHFNASKTCSRKACRWLSPQPFFPSFLRNFEPPDRTMHRPFAGPIRPPVPKG